MHTRLLISQRNEVFALIRAASLDISQFVWTKVTSNADYEDRASALVDRIEHQSTGFYFMFDECYGDAQPYFYPNSVNLAPSRAGRLQSWGEVIAWVKSWVSVIKAEILEPDLWGATKEDKKLIAANIDDIENLPFTLQEQVRVKVAVEELRNFIRTTNKLSSSQLIFVDARLRHLQEASSRLGRKDWITLAMGTFVNIVVGVALAPEAAKELIRTAGSLLGWIVGGIQLIP
jgi:hypothetical protein